MNPTLDPHYIHKYQKPDIAQFDATSGLDMTMLLRKLRA
jgi:hypothetical protein